MTVGAAVAEFAQVSSFGVVEGDGTDARTHSAHTIIIKTTN